MNRRAGYLLLFAFVGTYYGAGLLAGVVDGSDLPATLPRSLGLAAGFALAYAVVQFYRLAIATRTAPDLLRTFRERMTTPDTQERMAMLWPLLLAFLVFFNAFIAWKLSIPRWNAYDGWDPLFAKVDRVLHGRDPLRWTHAAIGERGTFLVDWFYVWGWWGGKVWVMAFIMTFDRLDRRLRYLWASALTWVVGGTLLATIFASGGPVYYARFGFGPDFQDLALYLRQAAPQATFTADYLWNLYLTREAATITGISAMPSMHVAAAALLAYWGWDVHRWLGAILTANALLVMLGSVHLGWHYAIDGYAGAGIAWGCWWMAERLVAAPMGSRPPGPCR